MGVLIYLKLVVEHMSYNRGETIEANLLLRMMSKVIGYFQFGDSYYGNQHPHVCLGSQVSCVGCWILRGLSPICDCFRKRCLFHEYR